jgi:hypothetical protein
MAAIIVFKYLIPGMPFKQSIKVKKHMLKTYDTHSKYLVRNMGPNC